MNETLIERLEALSCERKTFGGDCEIFADAVAALKATEAEQLYFGELHEKEWRSQVARAEKAEADLAAARAEIERLTEGLLWLCDAGRYDMAVTAYARTLLFDQSRKAT